MRISYAPEALADLKGIHLYITETLNNPQAAKNTLTIIKKNIGYIKTSPLLGSPIASFLPKHIKAEQLPASLMCYRRLICNKYSVFYRIENKIAFVDRVIHGSRDFINQLSGPSQGIMDSNE